jgi:metal-responsive CopG/Arc/MetJ family transcriptional regulator
MGFLYQIERKQAVLIAERATAPKKVVPQRGAARKNTPAPETTTLGVQMDLDLNEQVEALVARGVAPTKKAVVLAALGGFLAEHEHDENIKESVRKPTVEGKRVIVGVELDTVLNARLDAFCERFTCYKRRAAVAALTYYVEKHREKGKRR